MSTRAWILAITVLTLASGAAMSQTAQTSTPDPAAVTSTAPLGSTPAISAADEANVMSMERAVAMRNALSETLQAADDLPGAIDATLRQTTSKAGEVWLPRAIILAIAALVIGFAARFGITRWAGSYVRAFAVGSHGDRAARVGLALLRIAIGWLGTAAFFLVGVGLLVVFAPEPGPSRWTAFSVLLAVLPFLLLRDVFRTILAPSDPQSRLPPMDSAAASAMLRQLLAIIALASVLLGITVWLAGLGLAPRAADFMRICTSLTSSVLMACYVVVHRRTVAGLIRGARPRPQLWRRVLAALWHILAVVYLAIATGLNVVNIVISEGFRTGPVLGPIVAFLAGFATFAVAIVLIDRRFRAQQAALSEASTGTARTGDGLGSDPLAGPVDLEPLTRSRLRWKAFGDHVAGVASMLVGFAVLLAVWGQLSREDAAFEWLGTAVALFVMYVIYQAVATWIDGRMEDERGGGHAVDSEDGMGPGSSRLATLLPLLRNALVITIGSIAAMVVLAGLGVNVAPLFAGAGVVGLAVGFGAQSLIRDIFSGAFFLVDDAFRRGEYLDAGGVTGSVEKISLRSFQLRHHNGPLHTIPFGEIKRLTNFSRDWVVMKLKLRLVYGTDIERVRKLIKNLGQDLATDAETGPLFLQPLKSQGVVEMDDSAMILRVKFMTKPGDQFLARRHVYSRITELFEEEGIGFASRQVTVRVENVDSNGGGAAQAAALGGVEPVLEAEARAGRS